MKNKISFLFLNLFICFCVAQTDTDGFYFDGVDDFINVGNASNTSIDNINRRTTNNRTYETWFKAEEVTTRQFIIKEGAGTRAAVIYIENGFLVIGMYNRADYTPLWEGTFFREPIIADTWYHVAMVLDNGQPANNTTNPMGANQNTALKFYLDGTLIGENSGYQLGGHNTLRLGYRDASLRLPSITSPSWTSQLSSEYFFTSTALSSVGGSDYFEGYLWGFRLWNRVRTQQEIDDFKSDIITTVGTDDLVAILDGDTFSYLANDNTSTEEATVSPVDVIVWSANAGSSDWNTGANWVGGAVPDFLKKEAAVIQESNISVYPIITSGQHIVTGDLTVDANAEITINSNATIEVAYDLLNNGAITVEDTGSLILREKESSISAGTFNIKRLTPTYSDNDFYSYWSSPVNSGDSNIATVFSDAELIYAFEASSANSDWVFHGTSDFLPGVGYAVQNEGVGGQLRSFTGNINKGDYEIPIYNTTNLSGTDNDNIAWSTSGDNLLGNPYPAAIDWDLVVTDPDNGDIEGEVYFWKQNSAEIGENNVSDYLVYNLTGTSDATSITNGYIGSAQGFFIKTNSTDPDLKITFKTTHQVPNQNSTFYKRSKKSKNNYQSGRSWFTFKHKEKTNTLLIGFVKGATDNYDRLYDAPYDIDNTSMGFYSLTDDAQKVTIQGLPELDVEKKAVKLCYNVDQVGKYSIGIQSEFIDKNYNIYLKDNKNNTIVDLRQNTYNFTIDYTGENNTRFEIIYAKENILSIDPINQSLNANTLSVFINKDKELVVDYSSNNDKIKEINLFNIQGKKINQFFKGKKTDISKLSNGVYILNVKLAENKAFNKKILVNH